jgi:adenylate kinase
VIKARITEYKNKTSVVADYYRQFDKLAEIKGEGSVEDIFEELSTEIETHL